MLECVINVSEGRDEGLIRAFANACGSALLDVHADPYHNRSVYTLAHSKVIEAALELASCVALTLDLTSHHGVHPRLGALDVVPFVPLGDSGISDVLAARELFAREFSSAYQVPCFYYGPERSLPFVRSHAFVDLFPDMGPSTPHATLGACAVGARGVLVAYNLFTTATLEEAKRAVLLLRRPGIRALALDLDGRIQVSMNLTDPNKLGPQQAFELTSELVEVQSCELVGLIPENLLEEIPSEKWPFLDLSREQTLEYRLENGFKYS